MIATCPACGKRYRLADDAVPAAGRALRCAVCGHGWTVMPAAAAVATQLPFDLPAVMPPAPSPVPVDVAALPMTAPRSGGDTDGAKARRGCAWPLLFVAVAVGGLALIEFAPVTTFDPPRLGLPAIPELRGIALPRPRPLDLTAIPVVGARLDGLINPPAAAASPLRIAAHGERRRLSNGTWLLSVTGSVTNPTAAPVALAGIDAALLDPAGHVAFRWRIAPPVSLIEPHGSAAFESIAANFPPSATVLRLAVR